MDKALNTEVCLYFRMAQNFYRSPRMRNGSKPRRPACCAYFQSAPDRRLISDAVRVFPITGGFAFCNFKGEYTRLKRDHIIIRSDEDGARFCFRLGRLKYISDCGIHATQHAGAERISVCHSASSRAEGFFCHGTICRIACERPFRRCEDCEGHQKVERSAECGVHRGKRFFPGPSH